MNWLSDVVLDGLRMQLRLMERYDKMHGEFLRKMDKMDAEASDLVEPYEMDEEIDEALNRFKTAHPDMSPDQEKSLEQVAEVFKQLVRQAL